MEWRVPLADVNFTVEEETAVRQVIHSGWLTMGGETHSFEQEFAQQMDVKHAIAVTNGTAALHLACLAAGLGAGDEVILPSLTFVATANAVRYTGATPVFADVESLDWLTIAPSAIEASLTPRTKAILVMHYAGFACDMPAILNLAGRHNLVVLEDAAHAAGATLEGRSLGAWGTVGCFSFFPNKNMTTAEGGMLVTDDDAVADRLRLLRSHGMTSLTWDRHRGHSYSYDVIDLGYNYRIDEMRSALGRVQLGKLPASNQRRAELTALYRQLLTELTPQVSMPFISQRGNPAFHILPVILPSGIDRLHIMEFLRQQGIQTSIHYPPIHRFSDYARRQEPGSPPLPVTEQAAARELTLPLYPTMSAEQVRLVVSALQEALKS